MPIDARSVLCAQLTRHLLAIAILVHSVTLQNAQSTESNSCAAHLASSYQDLVYGS